MFPLYPGCTILWSGGLGTPLLLCVHVCVWSCLYVQTYVYVEYIYVCVHVRTCMWRPRTILGVTIHVSSTFFLFLESGSLTDLKLTRLASQGVSGVCCFYFSSIWIISMCHLVWLFKRGLRRSNSGPYVCRVSTPPAKLSPFPCSSYMTQQIEVD